MVPTTRSNQQTYCKAINKERERERERERVNTFSQRQRFPSFYFLYNYKKSGYLALGTEKSLGIWLWKVEMCFGKCLMMVASWETGWWFQMFDDGSFTIEADGVLRVTSRVQYLIGDFQNPRTRGGWWSSHVMVTWQGLGWESHMSSLGMPRSNSLMLF